MKVLFAEQQRRRRQLLVPTVSSDGQLPSLATAGPQVVWPLFPAPPCSQWLRGSVSIWAPPIRPVGMEMPNAVCVFTAGLRVYEPQGPRELCPRAFSSCCSTALAAYPHSQGEGQHP